MVIPDAPDPNKEVLPEVDAATDAVDQDLKNEFQDWKIRWLFKLRRQLLVQMFPNPILGNFQTRFGAFWVSKSVKCASKWVLMSF